MEIIDKLSMLQMAVADVDKAKEFYTNQLGFKAVSDSKDFGQVKGTARWVSILPPGGGATITLTNAFENMKPGTMKLYISTPDVEAAYKELQAKDVKLNNKITDDSWGKWFDLNDPDGNRWLIVQSKY
jgi:catechol 2,3-dioxygenase-like lactoylglutathione lyase family enzyme